MGKIQKESLIWVNEHDEEIGCGEKMETHIKGILHRAFSVFIYNQADDTFLIHKRAFGKYHSGGLWTNSCCSHPHMGEILSEAVIRRIWEELGLSVHNLNFRLIELGKFKYFQKYDTCSEHEIDHVFCMIISQKNVFLNYNKSEVEEIKWIKITDLDAWLLKEPEVFTAWFSQAYEIARLFIQQITT